MESLFSMSGLKPKSGQFEQSKKKLETDKTKMIESTETLGLKLELPHYEYSRVKLMHVPLDRVRTNDLRFNSLQEALKYIKGHCMFHFGRFNQNMAKQYLPDCSVYDPFANLYIVQENICIKAFRRAFNSIDL